MLAYARILQYIRNMTDLDVTNTLRLLQSADEIRARLSGGFGAVHGISVNEFFLLKQLERAPENKLPRVELAKRMHVSASPVTRMVAPMEKIGLVDQDLPVQLAIQRVWRVPNPASGRSQRRLGPISGRLGSKRQFATCGDLVWSTEGSWTPRSGPWGALGTTETPTDTAFRRPQTRFGVHL